MFDETKKIGVSFHKKSLTNQSDKKSCDINYILSRVKKDGPAILQGLLREGRTGLDLTNVGDYHESMNKVAAAQQLFQSLPAKVRDRFRNDPESFLRFAGDSKNHEEMVKLGLAKKLVRDENGEYQDSSKPVFKKPSKEPKAQPKGSDEGGQPKGGST